MIKHWTATKFLKKLSDDPLKGCDRSVRRTALDRWNFLKNFLGVPTLYTAYNSSLLSEFISDSLPFICVYWQKYWLTRPTVPSSVQYTLTHPILSQFRASLHTTNTEYNPSLFNSYYESEKKSKCALNALLRAFCSWKHAFYEKKLYILLRKVNI
jgi:hypothetical protein